MTEEQIKESLSVNLMRLISNRSGLKCGVPDHDNGVDLNLTKSATFVNAQGKHKSIDTGQYLEFQLKATTENGIDIQGSILKYDLDADNYNKIIYRRDMNSVVRLYLILFVLPVTESEWLKADLKSFILNGSAYWYYPEPSDTSTKNTSKIRITIPTKNRVGLSFFSDLFATIYP